MWAQDCSIHHGLRIPVLSENMYVPKGENIVLFHDDEQLFKDTGVRY